MGTDPSCGPPKVQGDPSAATRHAVSQERYDDKSSTGRLRGSIFYPAHTDHFTPGSAVWLGNEAEFAHIAPAPIVILAHGVHPTSSDPAKDLSFLGYAYLQTALAWAGIVAVSVQLDFGKSPTEQAHDIRCHLEHLASRNFRLGDRFFAKLDLRNIGLFGHSRGGMSILEVPRLLSDLFGVRAVLALAAGGWNTAAPKGIPFMTILPAAEGGFVHGTFGHDESVGFPDVSGAKLYDHLSPAPFKAQLYVRHADHLLWNTEWRDEDFSPKPESVFPREHHQMILRSFGTAFFRTFLQDLPASKSEQAAFLKHEQGNIAFLNGFKLPKLVDPASPSSGQYASFEVDPDDLVPSWQSQFALTVEDYQQANGAHTNSLGGETTFHHLHWAQAKDVFYAGDTVLLTAKILESSNGPGFIRTSIPGDAGNMTNRTAILVRAAETLAHDTAHAGVSFELGLEGNDGEVAWVKADHVGGVPRPFRRDASERFVFKTLRFSLACFKGSSGHFIEHHRKHIRAILIRPLGAVGREIAFDTLQLE